MRGYQRRQVIDGGQLLDRVRRHACLHGLTEEGLQEQGIAARMKPANQSRSPILISSNGIQSRLIAGATAGWVGRDDASALRWLMWREEGSTPPGRPPRLAPSNPGGDQHCIDCEAAVRFKFEIVAHFGPGALLQRADRLYLCRRGFHALDP